MTCARCDAPDATNYVYINVSVKLDTVALCDVCFSKHESLIEENKHKRLSIQSTELSVLRRHICRLKDLYTRDKAAEMFSTYDILNLIDAILEYLDKNEISR